MQPFFIVIFMSIFFANILKQKSTTGSFLCQFVNHVRHSETSFSVLDTLH